MIDEIQSVVEHRQDDDSSSSDEDDEDEEECKSYEGMDALRSYFRISEDFKKRVKREHMEEEYRRVRPKPLLP